MKEQFLEKYRKIYLHKRLPVDLEKNGWDDLRIRIAKEEQTKKISAMPGSLAFLSLIGVLVLTAFVGGTALSKPGQPLYLLKSSSLKFLETKPLNTPGFTIKNQLEAIPTASSQAQLKKLNTPSPTSSIQPKPSPGAHYTTSPQPVHHDRTVIDQAVHSIIQEIKKLGGQVQGIHTEANNHSDNNRGHEDNNNQKR